MFRVELQPNSKSEYSDKEFIEKNYFVVIVMYVGLHEKSIFGTRKSLFYSYHRYIHERK